MNKSQYSVLAIDYLTVLRREPGHEAQSLPARIAQQALDRLAPGQKWFLKLHVLGGVPLDCIATIHGMSVPELNSIYAQGLDIMGRLVAEICNNCAKAQQQPASPVVKTHGIKKVNLLDSTEPLTFPTACKLLQIRQKPTNPEIKKAYQRLIKKHHPDSCDAADTAAVEAANRRTCRINEAVAIVRAEMRKRRLEMK